MQTPDNVWSYLNTHDAALRAQGADMDGLWALQKNLADKNVISTSTGRVALPKTKDQSKTGFVRKCCFLDITIWKSPDKG